MKWDSVVYLKEFGEEVFIRRVKKGMSKRQALRESVRSRRFVVKKAGFGIYTLVSAIVGGGKFVRHYKEYPLSNLPNCRCVAIPVNGLGGFKDDK